jgi:hypothetical protein
MGMYEKMNSRMTLGADITSQALFLEKYRMARFKGETGECSEVVLAWAGQGFRALDNEAGSLVRWITGPPNLTDETLQRCSTSPKNLRQGDLIEFLTTK